jgi:hypothetical protein
MKQLQRAYYGGDEETGDDDYSSDSEYVDDTTPGPGHYLTSTTITRSRN